MPVVSVLMTVYNREQYLAAAIQSVLNSSLKDFELIIADDQSSDSSFQIAKEFAAKDQRIKVFRNPENLGDYPNRNHAASRAKGKYIKFLDSDDILYSHGLEIMVRSMETFPEAAIGFSDHFDEGDRPYPYEVSSAESYERHFFGKGFLYHGPSGCIYRRRIFSLLEGFNADFGVAADLEFNLRMAREHRVAVFNRDLYWWRKHEDQEINLHSDDYEHLSHQIYKKYLNEAACPLGKDASRAYKNHVAIRTRRILGYGLKLKFGKAKKSRKNHRFSLREYRYAFLPSRLRN